MKLAQIATTMMLPVADSGSSTTLDSTRLGGTRMKLIENANNDSVLEGIKKTQEIIVELLDRHIFSLAYF